jgi:hypothetical protein
MIKAIAKMGTAIIFPKGKIMAVPILVVEHCLA